jgi:hypothetical protein
MSLKSLPSICVSSSEIGQEMAEKLTFIHHRAPCVRYTANRLGERKIAAYSVRQTGFIGYYINGIHDNVLIAIIFLFQQNLLIITL